MLWPREITWECGHSHTFHVSDGGAQDIQANVTQTKHLEEYTALKPWWCCSVSCCHKQLEAVEALALAGNIEKVIYALNVIHHQRCMALVAMAFGIESFLGLKRDPIRPVNATMIPAEHIVNIADRFRRLRPFFPDDNNDSDQESSQPLQNPLPRWESIRTYILSMPLSRSVTSWLPPAQLLAYFKKTIHIKILEHLAALKADAAQPLHIPARRDLSPSATDQLQMAENILDARRSDLGFLKTRADWLEQISLDLALLETRVRQQRLEFGVWFDLVRAETEARRLDLNEWKQRNLATQPGGLPPEVVCSPTEPLLSIIFQEDHETDISHPIELDRDGDDSSNPIVLND